MIVMPLRADISIPWLATIIFPQTLADTRKRYAEGRGGEGRDNGK
jgi:hypothetical protein